MRTFRVTTVALLTAAALLAAVSSLPAAVTSNVDPARNFAWGENVGWFNFLGEGTATNDALPPPVIGGTGLSGFAWGENIGWVNLGGGTNADPNGFGVIVNPGTGEMSGYAWGENVGWINFGSNYPVAAEPSRPMLNLGTGELTGFAWGENIGWINLDGSTVDMQAQVAALPPTPAQIADGIIAKTAIPLFSDRNADTNVDSADVVSRVNGI